MVPVLDRGLLLGDGIFETVRVKDGVPEFFEDHFRRLCESAALVRLAMPWTLAELEGVCAGICRRSRLADASVRLTVTRGVYRGTLSDTGDPPRLVATCSSATHLEPSLYGKGVAVSVASFPRVHAIDPRVKATAYLPAVLARLEADEQGCYEAMFLDGRGRILELSTATFFAVRDGTVLTPPLRLGILAGVTRKAVLRLARTLGHGGREAVLRLADRDGWQEAFLTSAVRGVVPIVKLGGRKIGLGRPGPVTRSLMAAFARETGRRVQVP
jgi:branched-chain amino acid aminotransferase